MVKGQREDPCGWTRVNQGERGSEIKGREAGARTQSLQATARSVSNTQIVIESHWKVLRREVAQYDFF